uniref:NADH-ubiquinone oxidoreductase chain 1 n=1 Tax=Hyalella sp. n. 1 FZ-2021 TaxID=2803338 RepID=A0A7T8ZSM1_9CRUS|nr:NADH dehydrogenase subunit 1 [Hyalella sp. n. 1 FZ-2021]
MVLSALKVVIIYIILTLMVLVSVAFITLMERKILGSAQIRLGPNLVGMWGLLQPFSDAIKLFTKEPMFLRSISVIVYLVSPVFSLSLMLIIWLLSPFYAGGLVFTFSLMFFICVSSAAVYPIISSGWASNCKYSILGGLRAVAQMISYEVSLAMVLLSLVWLSSSFNLEEVLETQTTLWNIMFFSPLSLIWLITSLAETNRTPYDFSEGESELVSGFNTEYAAGGFSLLFMAEYGNIIFMSLLFVLLFLSSEITPAIMVKTMFISFLFVWVRATLPRYRYDKLMYLAWKSLLPITLFMFIFYFTTGYYIMYY